MTTELKYLQDSLLFQIETTVTGSETQDGLEKLTFQETIFHPQGGGQPSDMGTIEKGEIKFIVEKLTKKDGQVFHFGKYSIDGVKFEAGDKVVMNIDKPNRIQNMKLHSGGHLLDVAVRNIGCDKWIGLRGYHFIQSPYVEYDINGQDLKFEKNEFVGKLQAECDRLIKEGKKVGSTFVEYEKIKEVIGTIPDYLEKGQSLRVVDYEGVVGPCSGTHVSSLDQIEKIVIRKYQKKGNAIKISYSC